MIIEKQSKNDVIFTSFKMAISCKRSDNNRYKHIDKILIKDDQIVATDGHQLFVSDVLPLKSLGFEPGIYDVRKHTTKLIELEKVDELDNSNYPNYMLCTMLFGKETFIDLNQDFSVFYTEIIKEFKYVTFNYRFLLDMFKITKYFNYRAITGTTESMVKIKIRNDDCVLGDYYLIGIRINR